MVYHASVEKVMIIVNQTTEKIVVGPYTFLPGGTMEVSYNTGYLSVFIGTKGLTLIPTTANERMLVHSTLGSVIAQRAKVKTLDEIKKDKNPQKGVAKTTITKEANAIKAIPAFVKKKTVEPAKDETKTEEKKNVVTEEKKPSEERVIYRSPSRVVDEYKKSTEAKPEEEAKISLNNKEDVEGLKKLFSSKSIEEKMEKASNSTNPNTLSNMIKDVESKKVETVVKTVEETKSEPSDTDVVIKKITKKKPTRKTTKKSKPSTNQELKDILDNLG